MVDAQALFRDRCAVLIGVPVILQLQVVLELGDELSNGLDKRHAANKKRGLSRGDDRPNAGPRGELIGRSLMPSSCELEVAAR